MRSSHGGFARADLLRILTVTIVAAYLVPEGAHFFEMFSKMKQAPPAYMTVQRIYDGWAFFGVVIVLAFLCTLRLAVTAWRNAPVRWLALAAFAALLGTQVIFWSSIYAMNGLTQNWTRTPDNLEAIRQRWEYGHAASAALTLLALVLVVWAVLIDVRAGTSAVVPMGAARPK